jgi:hypothetical protein
MIESRTDGLTQIQLRGDQTRYYLINPLHDKLENLMQFGVAGVELFPANHNGPGYSLSNADDELLVYVSNSSTHKTVVSVDHLGNIVWKVYKDEEYREMFVAIPKHNRFGGTGLPGGGFITATRDSEGQIVYNLSGSQP